MTALPGDLFVVRTAGWKALIIRWGTNSEFNHAGVIVTAGGQTVEAKSSGACYGNIADYARDRKLVGSTLGPDDPRRPLIVANARAVIGTPYGWLDILSLGLMRLGLRDTWVRNRVMRSDRLICSQLVDETYTDAGARLFDDFRPPMDVTPGDLAGLLEGR